MIKFLLYLFESSICIGIFYLAYEIFFKKETYFNFNRLYLQSSMIFAVLIPIIHIHVSVSQVEEYETPVKEIGKFRSYYTELFANLDPEYNQPVNPWLKPAEFEDAFGYDEENKSENNLTYAQLEGKNEHAVLAKSSIIQDINITRILLILYISGIIFFCFRLVYLLYWIRKTISNSRVEKKSNHINVNVQKEMPPFSFFNYVFINKEAISPKDYEQIIAHEIIHVRQKHSLDLICAHVITVLQWFNPLVWLLQKAIKTNHEYIADRKVVEQGFEIIDYQSLLLSQLISIRSVELVNNFNLISIKKRLAMMTKIKSSFKAKMKAIFVVPITIILFFIFSDMTIAGPDKILSNMVPFGKKEVQSQLDGIWINTSETFGKYIQFKNNKICVLDGDINYQEYDLEVKGNYLNLNSNVQIKYKFEGSLLKLWWNENAFSVYEKSTADNSLKAYMNSKKQNLSLPDIVHYKTLEKTEYILEVFLNNDGITIHGKEGSFDEVEKLLNEAKQTFSVLELPFVTIKLYADKNTKMIHVDKIRTAMRNLDLLKIAYAGNAFNRDVPDLMEHLIGIPQLLPPKDVESIEVDNIKEDGYGFYEIDTRDDLETKEKVRKELHSFLTSNEKYVMCISYYNNTEYKDQLEFTDIVYQEIYKLRNEAAITKFGFKFDELAKKQQKEIKSLYKLVLTQRNMDKQ